MSDETSPASDGDDEFAGLAPAPPRRSPLVAVAVIGLAAAIGWHLRTDLAFAFRSRTPVDLGDARSLTARGAALEDNGFVTLSGLPDRRDALSLEPKGEQARQTFFRLYGTESRLFVRAADSALREQIADRWTGRLRRFDTLPYAGALRAYYREQVKTVRFLSLPSVRQQFTGSGGALTDRGGERVQVGADQILHVDRTFPDGLVVLLSSEKYPGAADARHELEQLGLRVTAERKSDKGFEFVVAAPAAERNAIVAKLDPLAIPFFVHQERQDVPLAKLTGVDEHVTAVSVDAPILIAADAWVLTEDESPARYWWVPLILALMVAFAAFNAWYLVRARRA